MKLLTHSRGNIIYFSCMATRTTSRKCANT